MNKTAFLFAGQGAQTVGMGKDLAEQFPVARELFQQANQVLGYDLAGLCFKGPEAELTKTEHAQPAIYLVGWIAFQLLIQKFPGFKFGAAAGLSLGEFTALAAAGSLGFEDGLRLVRWRGQYMQEACETTRGAMAAVIGLEAETTKKICQETGVQLANLNCPGQLVISGEQSKVVQACELAKSRGAKRALPLNVAGAYHSPLMASAQAKLHEALEGIPLHVPSVPVLSNVTAQPHGEGNEIRRSLVDQVTASVRWEESMRYLIDEGFDRFVELGPGTVLSGFMKRIDRDVSMLNVGDVASLEKIEL